MHFNGGARKNNRDLVLIHSAYLLSVYSLLGTGDPEVNRHTFLCLHGHI